MTRRVLLREIAHARAGDKGNRSNVAVYAYQQRHFAALKAQLTPERLKAEFPKLLQGPVQRFALDHLERPQLRDGPGARGRGQRIPEPRRPR